MQQRSWDPVRVDVGLVRNVDTVTLQEAHPGQLELRDHVVELLLVEGPIERHLDGVHAGAKLVEALAAPTVVGLPRIDRHLDQHRGRGSRRALAHNQRNAPHGAGVRATHDLEFGLVVAGDRVRRDLDTIGHAPGGPEQPGDGAGCGWRGLGSRGVARAATRHAHDQAPPDPPVPPQPVHEHPIARARRRGHVQVKALPRGDAGLRSVTSDHRPRAGWDLPARGARARILSLHRIGGGRWHRGGCAATARSIARAEDEHHDRGADGEELRVWHDVSRTGRSWTPQRDPAARNAVPKNNSVQERSASSSCMATRIASHGRRMIHSSMEAKGRTTAVPMCASHPGVLPGTLRSSTTQRPPPERAAAPWAMTSAHSGTCDRAYVDRIASTSAGKSNSAASACTRLILLQPFVSIRSWAWASIASVRSTPTIRPPGPITYSISRKFRPVPHAMSITLSPARRPSACTARRRCARWG